MSSTADQATLIVPCSSCGQRHRVPKASTGTPRCSKCHSPLPWLVEADDTNYAEVALKSSLPVLVDLWAPWCGPCRAVAPAVEALAKELAGRLKVVKVNVDNARRTAASCQAQSIPTLLMLRGGQVVDRIVGALPAPSLRARVLAVLGAESAK